MQVEFEIVLLFFLSIASSVGVVPSSSLLLANNRYC